MHASSKWLIGLLGVIGLVSLMFIPTGFGYVYPLLLPYQWHKVLHIFGAIIFMGNIIVTGMWMLLAERTKQAETISFAARATNWADVLFTAPGIILILFNGQFLATHWGGVFRTSWITAALALFGLSGVVWIAFLIRYQHELIRLSGSSNGSVVQLPNAFFLVLHKWYFWGLVATLLPLASLVLMVTKPKLW